MHLLETVLFFRMKNVVLMLLLTNTMIAQNMLIPVEHPVYHFLQAQESHGHVNQEYWSTRPYTYAQINSMLAEIGTYSLELSETELGILDRFQKDFTRSTAHNGIAFPWSRSTIDKIIHPQGHDTPPFFMTYQQDDNFGWISWSETFRLQHNGEASRAYYTDHLEISGTKGRIDFTSQYTYHRLTRNDQFAELPESYKEGYILDRDYIQWLTWDYPTSSLTYTHPDFRVGIHRQPVYWGYSATNSPILSNNVNPLPHIEFQTKVRHLRFKFIHARLSPNSPVRDDTVNVRRNLAAHRVEFDLTPNFEFAFNEMIIYANREFEVGYLNPVNFFFAEEHVQGNLDNKLMAIDFKWRVLPGLSGYGTWFFDELDFWKLFSDWWGNKFVFQLGATYYPQANLPSVSLEYTAARPWTYAHKSPVNSYTSSSRSLGLPIGPNTSMILMSSQWIPRSSFNIEMEYKRITQYNGIGSDLLLAHSYVDLERGASTGFWNGDPEVSEYLSLLIQYRLAQYLDMSIYTEKSTDIVTTLGVELRF